MPPLIWKGSGKPTVICWSQQTGQNRWLIQLHAFAIAKAAMTPIKVRDRINNRAENFMALSVITGILKRYN